MLWSRLVGCRLNGEMAEAAMGGQLVVEFPCCVPVLLHLESGKIDMRALMGEGPDVLRWHDLLITVFSEAKHHLWTDCTDMVSGWVEVGTSR